MFKTIAGAALLVASMSSTASAEPAPRTKPVKLIKTCLRTNASQDGSLFAGCDASALNLKDKVKLEQNGCAKGQVALTFMGEASPLDSCFPPGVVQL